MPTGHKKSARMGRLDWLDLGLGRLAAEGAEALRIDALCLAAGRTKGSFYHHFADLDAFLSALVEHWADRQTHQPLAELNHGSAPAELSEALTRRVLEFDFHQEIGIRDLARRHSALAPAVAAIDGQRVAFLADLRERAHGITADEAAKIAEIEYAAFCGLILLNPDRDRAEQAQLAAYFDALVARAMSPE